MTRKLNAKESLQRFKMVFYGVEVEGSKKKGEGEAIFNLFVFANRGLT